MRLDSFFSGALCVLSGGRLPEALFMVFLLDSKGAKVVSSPEPGASSGGRLPGALFLVFRLESQGAKVCKSCRSRQELSNELANIGVDTAENGPVKACQKLANLKVFFQARTAPRRRRLSRRVISGKGLKQKADSSRSTRNTNKSCAARITGTSAWHKVKRH